MNGNALAIALASIAGLVVPIQALLNARLGGVFGGTIAGVVVNFTVGLTLALCLALAMRIPLPTAAQFGQTQWWMYLGGFMGVTLVFSSAFAAPKLGAAFTIAIIVTAQLVTATALDHFGALGLAERPIGLERVIGIALLIAGVYLIQRS